MLFISDSNILMHSSLVYFIVINLIVYLFLMLDVSNSCIRFCPI
jgi:hypothetical protein